MLTWDPRTHGNMRKLVESAGWEKAIELVNQAVAGGKSLPVGYALAVWGKGQAERDLAAHKADEFDAELSKLLERNRRDRERKRGASESNQGPLPNSDNATSGGG
jgi:hypothetical protein